MRDLVIQKINDTLHAYLEHLYDAFVVRTRWIATASERRRMVNPPGTLQRELRALADAAHEHPRASQHIVTLAAVTMPKVPNDVRVHAAASWLLRQDA